MDKIDDLLTRGVANVIPSKKELEKLLRSKKKLSVYFGIDPTAAHLHLGNATHLRRIQALSELGHKVTLLIGDFTALIGDTSDKDKERPVLSLEEINANWQTYKEQAQKIIDFSTVEIRRNSEWLSQLNFKQLVQLCQQYSLNDFISRELIKKRLQSGGSVRLDETLYPIMQGYDSYWMDTDIQLGGTDQTFNMQAGRILQKKMRDKESFILAGEFLEGTDGRKMSKSWGNAIWLDDPANDMYGKVMTVRDNLIDQYFLLATNLPRQDIPQNESAMNRKKKLAWRIVSELHSPKAADQAQSYFESTFQHKQLPQDMPQYQLEKKQPIVEVLVATSLATSKSDARRLIDQKGVRLNGEIVNNFETEVVPHDILQVGPRKFVKLI